MEPAVPRTHSIDKGQNFFQQPICNCYNRYMVKNLIVGTCRDEDPVLAKNPDPGLCTSNEGRFLKIFKANILDNF